MAANHLMSEEDVRQYFIHNNGVVRNTDIVTHFRSYLSNPNIRDEARVLFKTYVNKLASVITEKGEKFLVLKPQYHDRVEERGVESVPSTPNYFDSRASYSNSFTSLSPLSGPDDSKFPPPYLSQPPLPHALSNSHLFHPFPQSQVYGQNEYSLRGSNSNNNGYNPNSNSTLGNISSVLPPNQGRIGLDSIVGGNVNLPPSDFMSSSELNMAYGLPSAPTFPPPNNILPSMSPLGGPTNMTSGRLPPPYRPPPPAAPTKGGVAPPFSYYNNDPGPGWSPENFQARFQSPPQAFSSEPSTPIRDEYQRFQRCSSVSGGLPSLFQEEPKQLDCPPPPVPPRSKRGSFEKLSRTMSMSVMDEYKSSNSSKNKYAQECDDVGKFSDTYMAKEHSSSYVPPNTMAANFARESSKRPQIYESERENVYYNENEKENANLWEDRSSHLSLDTMEDEHGKGKPVFNNENPTDEQKISVKERLQKFNRIASESELTCAAAVKTPGSGRIRRENTSKIEVGDYDTASISSFGFGFAHMQPKDKEWIVTAAQCNYHTLNKMAQENPELVKRKDINYTALHWAAKHGNADLVKLLAGTYKSDVNAKSNGGYTPLHLAAQFSRQIVYDLLSEVYNADVNVRDYSGKKPMQYFVRQDTTVSMDTFKKLKEKRRSTEQRERDSSFLRIGSLNVRVKKTTEAFGYFLGKSNSASNIERILHNSWGSADNIPGTEALERDRERELMPPPSTSNTTSRLVSKSNSKRKVRQNFPATDSTTIKEIQSDSDSDTACGFGSDWKN